ncbi:MAG: hypothetical protein NC122_04750 [Faecalibacterium sp.]|nr:hypothetical protein [Ruminococcus sp.]MCM1391543.1 hypothetical protein [Ruminococcus sp.]MCM1485494.1 hypothetical protein [Faecalibacterium sp.]
MIDIKKLDRITICKLHNLYTMTKLNFKCEPENVELVKQEEMRKWLNKEVDIADENFPQEIADIFSFDIDAGEFWNMMKKFSYYAIHDEEYTAVESNEETEILKEFPFEVQAAFDELIHDIEDYYWQLKICDDKAYFELSETISHTKTLILSGVENVPDDLGEPPFSDFELRRAGDNYCLDACYYRYNDEFSRTDEKTISLVFSDAEVLNGFYRSGMSWGLESPWDLLIGMACEICDRAKFPNFKPNEDEKNLLPLLYEVTQLEEYREYTPCSLPLLKAEFEKYGYNELTTFAERIENGNYTVIAKLVEKLNRLKYADLWHDIYYKVEQSQKPYPSLAEEQVKNINVMRNSVQQKMRYLGYSGTYPNFYKEGRLSGVHLEMPYGKTYFVGPAKKVVNAVSFFEYVVDNQLCLVAVDGCSQLKKGEHCNDIFDCCFNADGRRIFHSASNFFKYDEIYRIFYESETGCTVEQFAEAAAKKAELRKLTKVERKLYNVMPGVMFSVVDSAIFMGLFWGFSMALVFTVVMLVFSIAMDDIGSFFEMVNSPWWWLTFAAGGTVLSVIHGVCERLARRR